MSEDQRLNNRENEYPVGIFPNWFSWAIHDLFEVGEGENRHWEIKVKKDAAQICAGENI